MTSFLLLPPLAGEGRDGGRMVGSVKKSGALARHFLPHHNPPPQAGEGTTDPTVMMAGGGWAWIVLKCSSRLPSWPQPYQACGC